jgi:hypothetical protein
MGTCRQHREPVEDGAITFLEKIKLHGVTLQKSRHCDNMKSNNNNAILNFLYELTDKLHTAEFPS